MPPRFTRGRRQPRRGVLLLIVLSLLVLFVLLGLTFIVTSGQFRRAAGNAVRQERSGDAPQQLMQIAIHQMLRGTLNSNSALFGHSLLNDAYGQDGLRGFTSLVASGSPSQVLAGGELLEIHFSLVGGGEIQPNAPIGGSFTTIDSNRSNAQTEGFYNGCLLTMTTGPATGRSTRVLRYSPANQTILVEAFPGFSDAANYVPDGHGFIINGPAFSGVGSGYDKMTGNMDYAGTITSAVAGNSVDSTTHPVAFLPNFAAYNSALQNPFSSIPYAGWEGGLDESYDIPDYQNMFLAYVPADPTKQAELPTPIIPSFHRPALVNYFEKRLTDSIDRSTQNRDFWRTVILRPTKFDHPKFDGSNPIFDPIDGPWDIDNDANGIPDSIWVDLGLPVQLSDNGRLYKPLFAILCRDFDSCLNVNAHGTAAQLDPQSNFTPDATVFPNPAYVAGSGNVPGGGNDTTVSVLRGAGYGPAEAILAFAMLDSSLQFDSTEVSNLMAGRYVGYSEAMPRPGIADLADRQETAFGWPMHTDSQTLPNPLLLRPGNVRPPDLHGVSAVALDHAGQPLHAEFNQTSSIKSELEVTPNNWLLDNPYETNLVTPTAWDDLYTTAELEPLLRFYDIDRPGLPSRLMASGAWNPYVDRPVDEPDPSQEELDAAAINRQIVTTASFEVPVTAAPLDPLYLFELGSSAITTSTPDDSPQKLAMVPTELLRRQKMDLNRPFGDGRDGVTLANGSFSNTPSGTHFRQITGRLVADETDELQLLRDGNPSDQLVLQDLLNNASYVDATHPLRQAYARHLYCTAMMILGPKPNQAAVSRQVAQWAVNVVDFRDADSIMTPFRYDPNPFDGWDAQATGNLNSLNSALVVWGCERPELLITEALATHDRRTEDLDIEDVSATGQVAARTDDPQDPDEDFDQRLRPMGSLFIELFNPWVGTYSKFTTPNSLEVPPADLYGPGNASSVTELVGVMLNATSRDEGNGASPVWRMLIVKGESQWTDPDDKLTGFSQTDGRPSPTGAKFDDDDVERVVYFASTDEANIAGITDFPFDSNPGAAPKDRGIYVPSVANATNTQLLQPGRYAIVGSGSSDTLAFAESGEGGKISAYYTPFGRALDMETGFPYDDGVNITAARHIELRPASDPNTNQVTISGNTPPRPVTAVVIDRAVTDGGTTRRRLSISEPVVGYQASHYDPGDYWNPAGATREGEFRSATNEVYDQPFDARREDLVDQPGEQSSLMTTGIIYQYRTVFLQRLANPTKPWNAISNPYRTVDQLSVDLNVFNGVVDDDSDPALTSVSDPINFSTHERGWRETTGEFGKNPGAAILRRTFWQSEPRRNKLGGAAQNKENPIAHVFPYALSQSLGRLNSTYGAAAGGAYAGFPNTSPNEDGVKRHAFPWLTWNNRPFANAAELMLVPASSSSRLLHDFTLADEDQNLYQQLPFGTTEPPFRHLLNFFNTVPAGATTGINLLFDFVDVPSRFAGTQRHFNPTAFRSNSAGSNTFAATLRPPFNTMSRFRDPGLVNINTITNYRVFNALIGDPSSASNTATWPYVEGTMRVPGYDPATPGSQLDPEYPTQFPAPFKSASSAVFAPTAGSIPLAMRPVDAGLLRSTPLQTGTTPLLEYLTTEAYSDGTRNPYFRYKLMGKLDSMTTTRSSVFGVWITVGYFEVETAPFVDNNGDGVADYNPVYPDGYQLGQELGTDTGEIKRHRAFYMIDRSIPVAFEPGVNHNVDDAIILQRFIE